MRNMIEIRPTSEKLRAFAVWAVAQKPKLRTVGPNVFAVPAELFPEAPEEILIGSLVDGHRYVSPDEDAAQGHPAPGELLGVATSEGLAAPVLDERKAVPGEPLHGVPAETHGPDSVPLPALSEDDSGSSDPAAEVPEGVFLCGGCDREFTSERGRDTHRRQKHPEA
ncbi:MULTISPECIES: hypothetical protein [unclassified Streptomyces]|uniref:hypothetical protein n=1 Tax=unclassified Streptomyces TaxID=2593676 RepID=UPI002025947E|nr:MULTISPECIES: hypothetical protein [unclassified Streptomyces]MCX4550601.1 hypothetical protein [Streptomyces sp. NBC_01500]WSC22046.1 hypothetical protein OIE60_21460 [Streptomyces sp. NBC_01766]